MWILLNIIFPIVLPLALIGLCKLVDIKNDDIRKRVSLLRAIQDGQLCWVSLGFSASAIYDIFKLLAVSSDVWLYVAIFCAIACMVLSALLAVLGQLFPLGDARKNPPSADADWKTKLHYYRLLVTSIVILSVSALVYTLAQFAA